MAYEIRRDGVFDDSVSRLVQLGAEWFAFRRAWFAGATVTVAEDASPLDPPTAAEIAVYDEQDARDGIRIELRADATVQALSARTPAQVDSWIDANVNSLADARAVLKIIARILAHVARQHYT